MLKRLINLPKSLPLKGKGRYVKKLLASNMAFIAITIPAIPTNISGANQASLPVNQAQATLLIPQKQLDSSFNIASTSRTSSEVQIPITYIYMSQGYSSFHPGIDLATDYKTPIKPIKPGTVTVAGYSPFGYGNEVIIDHGDDTESLYAHLSKISVKVGDQVGLDSIIGLVGSTGHSTGPHLHLEIHKNGKSINPLSILPKINTSLKLLTSK